MATLAETTGTLLVAAALATTLVLARPATADAAPRVAYASAETLRHLCLAGGTPRARCSGYLMGVADSLRHPAVAAALASGGAAVCLPRKLSGEQIRNLFLNHLHRHPERAVYAAPDAVWSALLESFACARKPAPDVEGEGAGEDERISRLGTVPGQG